MRDNLKLSNIYNSIKYDECFDPILVADTELFVDPFSVFEENDGVFANSFNKLIRFFNEAFKLAAACPNRQGVFYKKLESMMTFPEINEIGLGYSNSNTGLGTAKWFRDRIINSIYSSIDRGFDGFSHFEEIGIFEKGIGCDRISDITCNILKEEIISYTQDICSKHNIPLIPTKMKNIRFDFTHLRWIDGVVDLPYNNIKNRGILLIPKRFLNDLPTINPDGFKDYIWDNKNEILRNDFNYSIKTDLDKKAIMEIARNYPEWVKEYEDKKETQEYKPYDLDNDKKGVYAWASEEVQEYIKNHLFQFSNNETFAECIFGICNSFKSFIENEKGYTLLWNEKLNKPKPESALQTLMYGFTKAYGMLLNIDITRESNAGSGPVDFKYSQGYQKRVLIETKLVSNSRYWNGLTKQLPQYMLAEGIEKGVFVLVAFTAEEFNKANDLKSKVSSLDLPYEISVIIVDATAEKLSASKL